MKKIASILILASLCLWACDNSKSKTGTLTVNTGMEKLTKAGGSISDEITGYTLTISGDDMDTITKSFSTTETVSVEVPIGDNRKVTLTADLDENGDRPILNFRGTSTMNIGSGSNSVSLSMQAGDGKLHIVDQGNNRIVEMPNFNSNPKELTQQNIQDFTGYEYEFKPVSINISQNGSIFIAHSGANYSPQVYKLKSFNLTNSEIFIDKETVVYDISSSTIDNNSKLYYYSYFDSDNGPMLYAKSIDSTNSSDPGTQIDVTSLISQLHPTYCEIEAIAIDDEQKFYIAIYNMYDNSSTLYKVNIENSIATIITSTTDNLNFYGTFTLADLKFYDNHIYLANQKGSSGYKIIRYDKNLKIVDHFGTDSQFLYYPHHFVSVSKEGIFVIDDESNLGSAYNRILSFKDMTGSYPDELDQSSFIQELELFYTGP